MASLPTEGLRRALYERLIYEAIERVPRTDRNPNTAERTQPLTLTQGQKVRQAIGEVIARQVPTAGRDEQWLDVKLEPVRTAIDTVLADVVGPHYESPFPSNQSLAQSSMYKAVYQDFMEEFSDGRVGLSPYDPRFAQRQFVMDNGVTMLYAPLEQMAQPDNGDTMATLAQSSKRYELTDRQGGQVHPRKKFTSISNDDRMGLTRLRPYIDPASYADLRQWVYEGVSRPINGEYPTMSTQAVDRAVAILEDLSADGVEFTIRKDRRPGQLRASITGGPDIRIADIRPDENLIGRGYNDGIETRFSLGGTGRLDDSAATHYTPTVEEAVALSRYARGVPVQRGDGRGLVGTNSQTSGQRDAYYTSDATMMKYGQTADGQTLSVRQVLSNHNARSRFFANAEVAENFVREAIDSARVQYGVALDIDHLISVWKEHGDDPEFQPVFTGPDDVAALRSDYWDVLTGKRAFMLPSGVSEDEYAAGNNDNAVVHSTDRDLMEMQVRDHARRMVDTAIGTYEPMVENGVERTFNPVGVANHMDSEFGVWRNNDDLVSAMRALNIDASQLRGDEFYNRTVADRLITFDTDSAVDMREHANPFIARMGGVIEQAISTNAALVDSIMIDDNGVVSWEATRLSRIPGKSAKNGVKEKVTGTIGQVLPQGEYGEVVTKFASSDNYMFVPGYEASVIPQKPGENLSLEERTVVRGYEQMVAEALRQTIHSDLTLRSRDRVGEPTSINSTLRRLYDTRHPVDFIERSQEEGLTEQWRRDILTTESLRVRYSTELRNGSTALRHRQENKRRNPDEMRNDIGRDPLLLTGNRNMSVLDVEASKGRFDPIMTGMALNQGVVRYLLPSATIAEDGRIIPGDPDDRVPVRDNGLTESMAYDPHDRQNMSLSNIMHASRITSGTRAALTQLNGWNFEDGVVVSQNFADTNAVRDTEGNMRPLVVGDKISDIHGNKGVISLIVDPEMDDAEAIARDIVYERDFFRANPDLDVVMAPYSPISRFNAGTTREMMAGEIGDLHLPDGTTVPGAVSDVQIVVTHMTVDAKTNVYDSDAMRAGKGRKASSQLAWALQGQGCTEVMRHLYGSNDSGISNTREYLVALGYDMAPDGELSLGYNDSESQERHIFAMPEMVLNKRGAPNYKAMSSEFGQRIRHNGGFMEIPVPLTLASGETTPPSPITEGAYLLPVLSSHLRQEQNLGDGTVSRHDYNVRYANIFDAATRYRHAKESLDATTDPQSRESLTATMSKLEGSMKREYSAIAQSITSRHIEGKRNIFRNQIMGNRVSHSATAVISADPRLNIDQIGMPPSMAHELGVEDGKHVMMFRDPILKTGGVRYMRVKFDDSLTGISMNPIVTESFGADFDGDSVGLVGNLPPRAHEEAMRTLTMEANLLNLGAGVSDGKGGYTYPLYMHTNALDLGVARHVTKDVDFDSSVDAADYDVDNPGNIGARFADIEAHLNEVYADSEAGVISKDEYLDVARSYMDDISALTYQATHNHRENITIQFGSMDEHMASINSIHERGAKGSASKVSGGYAVYLNVDEQAPGQWVDKDASMSAAEKVERERHLDVLHRGSQMAIAIKAQATGVAGARSQEAVKALSVFGGTMLATEYSAQVTEAMMKAKHDPVDGQYRADVLTDSLRLHNRGQKLEATVGDNGRFDWTPVKENGEPVRATRDEWVEQAKLLFNDDRGMGVALGDNVIDGVADMLVAEDGRMRDLTDPMSWPREIQPSPVDQMAYNGNLEILTELAGEKANMFDGRGSDFRSSVVRRNQRDVVAMMAGEKPVDTPLIQIAKSDTQQQGQRSVIASPPRVPVGASVSTTGESAHVSVEPDPKPLSDDDFDFDF